MRCNSEGGIKTYQQLFKDGERYRNSCSLFCGSRVLRKIYEQLRDEVMGGWRKLQNYQFKEDGWRMWCEWGQKRNVYRLMVGKPGGKRPLGGA
jgi:hypothetical protein